MAETTIHTNLNKDLIIFKPELRQRDLLSRPSAPRMARLSLQGGIHGESGEPATLSDLL